MSNKVNRASTNTCHFPSTEFGRWLARVLCNIGNLAKSREKPISREISSVHNSRYICPIGLRFCAEHGSDTVVLCAQFQSDRSTEAWVVGKRDFARFELKMNFRRISYIAQGPRSSKMVDMIRPKMLSNQPDFGLVLPTWAEDDNDNDNEGFSYIF